MKYMTKYMREYRKTRKWKIYHTRYNRLWREKHGTRKDNMRRKLLRKIKARLLKVLPCNVCGEEKVEMHHDDYRSNKIMFLCRIHHRERDVLMGKRKS